MSKHGHCKTKDQQKAFEEMYAKDQDKRRARSEKSEFCDQLVDQIERKRPKKRFYR